MEIKDILNREIKVASDEGIVEGYASVWGEPPDTYGDITVRGAFAESIAAGHPAFLWQHQMEKPIGGVLEMHEDEHGLFGRWQLDLDTEPGEYAFKMMKRGRVKGLSIGYQTLDADYSEDGQIRFLKKVWLPEVSSVTIPAASRATLTSVKTDLPFHVLLKQVQDVLTLAAHEAQALADRRGADHRSLNDRHIAAIEALLPEAKALVAALDALRVVTPDAEALASEMTLRLNLARARLALRRTG